MSLPVRTLSRNSKNVDFPVPVSTTRRMVYGARALFFDVLMIPFLSDCTSLESTVRTDAPKVIEAYLIAGASSSSSKGDSRLEEPYEPTTLHTTRGRHTQ